VRDCPRAVFDGRADGSSSLEPASGSRAGTLSDLGTQFVEFGSTTEDANADWTSTGANTLDSGATPNGTGVSKNDSSIVAISRTSMAANLYSGKIATIGFANTLAELGTVSVG
jgi:fibronectin-binding autotransporter adhesin